jgi:acyl-CoA thioesterase-1
MIRHISSFLMVIFLIILSGCSKPADQAITSSISCRPLPNGSGPLVYVAIGASDAVGFGAECADSQGYVPILGQKMPKGTHVVNLGIAGALASEAVENELPQALTSKPSIITVWLGGNDFREMLRGNLKTSEYVHQMNQLIHALHTQTSARIYMANLPDMALLPAIKEIGAPTETIQKQTTSWNQSLADIAQHEQVTLVDIYHSDLASHPEYIYADGFHPSTLGYQRLADIFWQAIQGK